MSHAAALEFYVFGDNRLTQVDRFDSVPWPSQLLPEPVRASWSLNAGFEQIKNNLPLCLPLLDFRGATQLLRDLNQYLSKRPMIRPVDRASLSRLAYDIIVSHAVDGRLRADACEALSTLMDVSSDTWIDEHSVSHRPEFAWKPFWALLEHLGLLQAPTVAECESRSTAITAHNISKQEERTLLYGVLVMLPRYFPATVAAEVWSTLSGRLNLQSICYPRDLGLLCLLMPISHPEALVEYVPKVMQLMHSFGNCPELTRLMFATLSRWAMFGVGVISWLPHLSDLMHTFATLLDVSSSKTLTESIPWIGQFKWLQTDPSGLPVYMSRILIASWHEYDSSHLSAAEHLVQFLALTKTLFYPSNASKSSTALASFLCNLCEMFTTRIGLERRGINPPGGSDTRLRDPQDELLLIEIVMPVLMQAAYSHALSMYVINSLNALASLAPRTVVPHLWSHFLADLDPSVRERSGRVQIAISVLPSLLCHVLKWRNDDQSGYPACPDVLLRGGLQPYLDQLPSLISIADELKTTSVLTNWQLLFGMVSVVDSTSFDCETEWDSAASQFLTQYMPDYCLTVLDRLLFIATNFDDTDTSSASASDESNTKVTINNLKSGSLYLSYLRCCRSFFHACAHSAPLFFSSAIVKKVLNVCTIEATRTPTTAVYLSGLLLEMVSTNVDTYVEPIVTALLSLWRDCKHSTDQVYALTLLIGAVRNSGSSALIRLAPALERVVHQAMTEQNKAGTDSVDFAVRKFGGKFARAVLHALTLTYTNDYAPHSARSSTQRAPWRSWVSFGSGRHHVAFTDKMHGGSADVMNLNIKWHIPTAAELQCARDLAVSWLSPCVDTIGRLMSSHDSKSANSEVTLATLSFLRRIVKGISGLLGPHSGAEATFGSEFKSNHDDIDSDDDAVIDWNVQLEKMNRSLQHHERTVQSISNELDSVSFGDRGDVNAPAQISGTSHPVNRVSIGDDSIRFGPNSQLSLTDAPYMSVNPFITVCSTVASLKDAYASTESTDRISIRTFLIRQAHSWLSALSQNTAFTMNSRNLRQMLRLSDVLLIYSDDCKEHSSYRNRNQYARRWLCNRHDLTPAPLRFCFVEAVALFTASHMKHAPHTLSTTQDVHQLMSDLCVLITNVDNDISSCAQNILQQCRLIYRGSATLMGDFTCRVLLSPYIAEPSSTSAVSDVTSKLLPRSHVARILGALRLLSSIAFRYIHKTRNGLQNVLSALIAGGAIQNDDAIQVALDSTFLHILQRMDSMEIHDEVPTVPADSRISSIQIALRSSVWKRDQMRRRAELFKVQQWLLQHAWNKLRSTLTSFELGSSVHWRYQLMCSTLLFDLMRAPLLVTRAVITHWSRLLLYSESLPLRSVALTALTIMLSTDKLCAADDTKRQLMTVKDSASCEELIAALRNSLSSLATTSNWTNDVWMDSIASTCDAPYLDITSSKAALISDRVAVVSEPSRLVEWTSGAKQALSDSFCSAQAVEVMTALLSSRHDRISGVASGADQEATSSSNHSQPQYGSSTSLPKRVLNSIALSFDCCTHTGLSDMLSNSDFKMIQAQFVYGLSKAVGTEALLPFFIQLISKQLNEVKLLKSPSENQSSAEAVEVDPPKSTLQQIQEFISQSSLTLPESASAMLNTLSPEQHSQILQTLQSSDLNDTQGLIVKIMAIVSLRTETRPTQITQANQSFTKLSSTALERELHHVTCAELFAGCARAVSRLPSQQQSDHIDSMIELLNLGFDSCGIDTLSSWLAALRFVCSQTDPRRPLVAALLKWSLTRVISFNSSSNYNLSTVSDSPSRDSWFDSLDAFKCLGAAVALVEPLCLIGWFQFNSNNMKDLQQKWWNAVFAAAAKPTSEVRAQIAALVSVCLISNRRLGTHDHGAALQAHPIYSWFHKLIQVPFEAENVNDTVELVMTVHSYVVMYCPDMSEFISLALIPFLLPFAYHRNLQLSRSVRAFLKSAAQISQTKTTFLRLLPSVVKLATLPGTEAWHTRLTAVHFLTIALPLHSSLLQLTSDHTNNVSARQTVLDALLPLLGDLQVEVAQAMKRMLTMCVSGVLLPAALPIGRAWSRLLDLGVNSGDADASNMDVDSDVFSLWRFDDSMIADTTRSQHLNCVEQRSALIKKFTKWAKAKKAAAVFTSTDELNAIHINRTRLAGVLGCAAMLHSEPFAVPDWMPELLDQLIALFNGSKLPLSIAQEIRNTIAEFRRTHADRWSEFQSAFTSNQLDNLRDMEAPPSYIA